MGPGSNSLAFGSHENMESMEDNQASSNDLAQCMTESFVFLGASGVSPTRGILRRYIVDGLSAERNSRWRPQALGVGWCFLTGGMWLTHMNQQ